MNSARVAEVAAWMERLYVGVPGARLRREDRRKAEEVAALLEEVARVVARTGGRERPFVLLDAAAGKGYVGLLAAKLVLEPSGRVGARVIVIEREPARSALAAAIGARLETPVTIESRQGDVAEPGLWPERPRLVTALHACGPAADAIIDGAIASRADTLLLVPCCTGRGVPSNAAALARAAELGLPRQAPVRRRFVQAFVDAERTLRLEAAGYQTEVVELCPPTLTPHNLLWRARRVGEPGRVAQARADLGRLTARDPDKIS